MCSTFLNNCVFCFTFDIHWQTNCAFVCVTGDDRHRQSDIWHDGEVHLPCPEDRHSQTTCGCFLPEDGQEQRWSSHSGWVHSVLPGGQLSLHLYNHHCSTHVFLSFIVVWGFWMDQIQWSNDQLHSHESTQPLSVCFQPSTISMSTTNIWPIRLEQGSC